MNNEDTIEKIKKEILDEADYHHEEDVFQQDSSYLCVSIKNIKNVFKKYEKNNTNRKWLKEI